MVHVDGSVTTCCLDEHLQNRLGNLRERPLTSLWWGERMHGWRMAQVLGRFEESGPMCRRCNWRSAGAWPVERVVEWLRRTGEDALARQVEMEGLPGGPAAA